MVYTVLRMSAVSKELYLIESSYNTKAQAAWKRKTAEEQVMRVIHRGKAGWPVLLV